MFRTGDAKVPVRAFASRERSFASTMTPSGATVMEILGCTRRVKVAFVPFTERTPPATATVLFPTAIGLLARRLIRLLVVSIIELPNLEQRLATKAIAPRLRVGNDASRGGENARTRATLDMVCLSTPRIESTTRL